MILVTDGVLNWFLFLMALVLFGVFARDFLLHAHWYAASLALSQAVVVFITARKL